MTGVVRPVTAGDRDAWLPLWQGYLDFYDTKLDSTVTDATWTRLHDDSARVGGLVAEGAGGLNGFLNFVLHDNTWTDRLICYLEDLYVAPHARGQGVGRALIEGLVGRARAEGWLRVYWMTREDNCAARRLYDSITPVTSWVRYDLNL